MIPFAVPECDARSVFSAVGAALRPRNWSNGPEIEALEGRVAQLAGSAYGVAFASARFGLAALFGFYGCRGRRVIIPAYTCIPVADSVRWAGAEPFFVDITLDTYSSEEATAMWPGDAGAVVISYLYGLVARQEKLIAWARDSGVPIIEDAAIALGAAVGGVPVGSRGQAAVFSLQSSKLVTGWRGGVVTTDDARLFSYLKNLQELQEAPSRWKVLFNLTLTGMRRMLASPLLYGATFGALRRLTLIPIVARLFSGLLSQNPSEAITGESSEEMPGYESARFSRPQAILAIGSIDRFSEILARRRELAARYARELDGVSALELPSRATGLEHAFGRFPVRFPGLSKEHLVESFRRNGVEVGANYPYVLPRTQHCRGIGNADAVFPASEIAATETVLLPMHTRLTTAGEQQVVSAARRVARPAAEVV